MPLLQGEDLTAITFGGTIDGDSLYPDLSTLFVKYLKCDLLLASVGFDRDGRDRL